MHAFAFFQVSLTFLYVYTHIDMLNTRKFGQLQYSTKYIYIYINIEWHGYSINIISIALAYKMYFCYIKYNVLTYPTDLVVTIFNVKINEYINRKGRVKHQTC